MSVWARIDTVGVGDERSGSRAHGGSGTRAVVLELTWWEWQTSSQARIDTMGVGNERSGSRAHGGGGTRVVGLKLTWWG